jgi:Fe-S cluster assembly protein SufB
MDHLGAGIDLLHAVRHRDRVELATGIVAAQDAGRSQNTYRGLVSAHRKAKGARNFTNCDSLLIGDQCAGVAAARRGRSR